MNEPQIERKIRNKKGLKQYKDWSEEKIRQMILDEESNKVEKQFPDIDITQQFEDPEEKRFAAEFYTRYCEDYEVSTISDKNMITNLVYLEVLNLRFQKLLNRSNTADSKTVPSSLIENLHDNLDKIISLKEKLGLTKDKDEEKSSDAIKLLQKKYKLWLSKNQGSRTMPCSHCGKMNMLRIKMDAWDIQKHPYYEDRLVYNKKLFIEYEKWKRTAQPVVIDKHFIAEVLDVSPDYIEDVISRRKGKSVNDTTNN